MAKVGCAGILVADLFCGPLAEFPAPGQLVTIDEMPFAVGGCAANVAVNLTTQGVDAELLGCLGKDADGQMLQQILRDRGVNCERVVWVDHLSTSKTVILLIVGQDRRYVHLIGANAALTAEHFEQAWLSELDLFYLGGVFAMPGLDPDRLLGVLKFCRTAGVSTVLDVVIPQGFKDQSSLQQLLPYVDYFLPNDEEAAQITGCKSSTDQLQCLQEMGAKTVIITRGRSGVAAIQDDVFWELGAYNVPAIDPSGAGDAFASGLIVGILRGWAMPEILRYASAVGASAIRAVGTTTSVFRESEAINFVESHPLPFETGRLEPSTVAEHRHGS